jgi:hypothetical protein
MESVGLWPGEEPVIGIEAPAPSIGVTIVAQEPRQVQVGIPAPLILLLGLLIAFDET